MCLIYGGVDQDTLHVSQNLLDITGRDSMLLLSGQSLPKNT